MFWYYTKFTLRHPGHMLRLLGFLALLAKAKIKQVLKGGSQAFKADLDQAV